MPTWFLPADLTLMPSKIPLGMILAHPKDPTDVLVASPTSFTLADNKTPIPLPEHNSFIEPKHVHSNDTSRSIGLNLLAQFAEIGSGSASLTNRRRNILQYSQVDHEIRTFKTPFSDEALAAIVRIPKIKNHIESSLFGNRPVYIVSGLRIANSSFSVTKVTESEHAVQVEGSGPAATVPGLELGGGVSGSHSNTRSDSYETAPGVVFAYQLYAIRKKGEDEATDPTTARLFVSRSAFMTGDGGDEEEKMELVNATREVLDDDEDEPAEYEAETFGDGDDVCVWFK